LPLVKQCARHCQTIGEWGGEKRGCGLREGTQGCWEKDRNQQKQSRGILGHRGAGRGPGGGGAEDVGCPGIINQEADLKRGYPRNGTVGNYYDFALKSGATLSKKGPPDAVLPASRGNQKWRDSRRLCGRGRTLTQVRHATESLSGNAYRKKKF